MSQLASSTQTPRRRAPRPPAAVLRAGILRAGVLRAGVLRAGVLLAAVLLGGVVLAEEPPPHWLDQPPQSPQQSLQRIRVRPGFRVELVAAEPLVVDPVAVAFAPDGRLWVVEMGDYPTGDSAQHPGGRIRVLRDTDGDGQYDASSIFLDDLSHPTGVMPWRRGALVTCAPEIFFAADSDGDGRADRRTTLFRGFVTGNPQHRVNGPRWGLDNWVHLANGDNGGEVLSLQTGLTTDIHGHDFRIRPDTGELDLESGMSQFGRCRDDWGNWYGGNSAWPLWHCVLPDRYLRRNPQLTPPNPCVHLMFPPLNGPVFPLSQPQPRLNEYNSANCLTSACGGCVYRDVLFGEEFSASHFICEPAHNLVHHEVRVPDGATFYSNRPAAERKTEFLASSDNWFRPVQVRTGPDGALWVVDMYRLIIEHPDYFEAQRLAGTAEPAAPLPLRAGSQLGRIYRVVREDRESRPLPGDLGQLTGPQLAGVLESPNGPQRDMAHRLIFERQDRSARGSLSAIAVAGRRAASRLQALCALEGLPGGAPRDVLLAALGDSHPAVRRHAVRIAEQKINDDDALLAAVLGRAADPDAATRLQVAFTLGQCRERLAAEALGQLALAAAEDPFLVAAVMSSATAHAEPLLAFVTSRDDGSAEHIGLITQLMRLAMAQEKTAAVGAGLRKLAQARDGRYQTWQFTALAELIRDWEHQGLTLRSLHDEEEKELREAIEQLAPVFQAARQVARDSQSPVDRRAAAVRLLGRWIEGRDDDTRLLLELLSPREPAELQRSAVAALGRLGLDATPAALLQNWRQHSPQLRSRILDTLLERKAWTVQLLDAVESGRVARIDIGARHRDRLKLHYHADVRRRASKLFNSASSNRQAVIQRYRPALQMEGDLVRGRQLFDKHCAVCHREPRPELQAGPDLGALQDRRPESLLIAILDPNRGAQPQYLSYQVETASGRTLVGLLAREAGASLTLVTPDGKQEVLLRRHVRRLASSGKSLMPEGLEQSLPELADMAGVLAYVRTLKPQPAPASRPHEPLRP